MKKIITLILSLIIVIGVAIGTLYYIEYNEDLLEPPVLVVSDTEISADNIYYEKTVLPYFPVIKKGESISYESIPTITSSSQNFDFNIDKEYEASIFYNEKEVYFGNDASSFLFNSVGDYVIKITIPFTSDDAKGYYDYSFIIKTMENPEIHFSSVEVNQGDLVLVEIRNVFNDYNVEINSKYSPSASLFTQEENKIEFYIPINYLIAAEDFVVDVVLSNEETSYSFSQEISVFSTEYETISFTVEESVTSSTVNSAAANQEYRETIHPLYYTKDSNIYWEGNFIKPTEETRVSSGFGQIRYINGAYSRHSGTDYAAPTGTPIYASNNGIIEYAGFLQLSGNTIVIEHGLGLKGYYMHMDSLAVNTGDYVEKGDYIGTVGTTGYSTGPHLHYQVSIENQPIDPTLLYNIE